MKHLTRQNYTQLRKLGRCTSLGSSTLGDQEELGLHIKQELDTTKLLILLYKKTGALRTSTVLSTLFSKPKLK